MARKQPTTKRRAPTRVRYDATYPALTVHFDLETYAQVVELSKRSGLTRSQVVRRGLGAVERNVDAVLARGHEQGVQEGHEAGYAAGYAQGRSASAAQARDAGYAEGSAAGYDEGYTAGYHEAVGIYRITYPCYRCGKPMEITTDLDKLVAFTRRALSRWGHDVCP